jgi:hypothetical protein
MSRRIRHRWKSKFARFARSYGVERLALQLDVRPSAIYQWIRGSTSPRPAHATILQRLARERRVRLTFDEIYRHRSVVRARHVTATEQGNAFIAVASGAAISEKTVPVNPSVGAAKMAP